MTPATITFRGLEPADAAWVIQRHGAIYTEQFGWNADFEALVLPSTSSGRSEIQAQPERDGEAVC